jgi:hypothetical protein
MDSGTRAYVRGLLGDRDMLDAARELVDAEECFYVGTSASLVLGLTTSDGSRVALKVVPEERRTLAQMQAAHVVQRALHDSGFPAPRPLAGPARLGRGFAVVDEWIDGEQRDLHDPALRRITARLLAELIDRAPHVDDLPGGLARHPGLFPPPHHPMFDFSQPEGRWIDEIAAGARARLAPERDVVGHSDWSTKNMSWDGDSVVAVYDWADSTVLEAEETIVGQASMFFPATWDLPLRKHATPEEADAFVQEYEEAAGRALDRGAVEAARLYVLAYSARCEISDRVEGDFCAALRELAL